MRLIPHWFTILVTPDAPPDRTDSGAIILPEDVEYVPTSGTVVAVGKGSKRLWEERQKAYGRALAHPMVSADSLSCQAIRELAGAREPCPSVVAGDRVVFAAEAGLVVKDEDGVSYILLEEDRVAIIVEEDEAIAV